MEAMNKNIQENRASLEIDKTIKQLKKIEGISFIILIGGTLLISLLLHVLFANVTLFDIILLILIALLSCLFVAAYTDYRIKLLKKDDELNGIESNFHQETKEIADDRFEGLQSRYDDLAKRYAGLRDEKAKLQDEKLALQLYIKNNEGNETHGN